ncbi:MAG: 2-phosphosulfolactate phosphatase [Bacteroidales bacterium]|nr:2-phosphosulfolactate phosphatase [Bacteroidales bacterium]
MNLIEVSFSTDLFKHYDCKGKIVVVVDILRATSVICTMFHNGVKEIIPVRSIEEAQNYKEHGFMVVAERDGKKLDFADFGNSPFYFTKEIVSDKTIVYSTTNGTNAITIGKEADQVIIGSFLNISSITNYLLGQSKDIIILCSGWKGKFCIEDSLLAGLLSKNLLDSKIFTTKCDSVYTSIDMWSIAKEDLNVYIEKAAQKHRLKKLGLDDVIGYCLTLDITTIVPILNGDRIISFKD